MSPVGDIGGAPAAGGDYDRISVTAKLAAYVRSFSDIPFARDVAERIGARAAFEQLLVGEGMSPDDLLFYAPIFETRYKAIVAAIVESRLTNVVELASGLSLRGLAMTADSAITYVETDLAELTDVKRVLVAEIIRANGLTRGPNYVLAAANAVRREDLRAAIDLSRPREPLAVVTEGLLQYLSATELESVAGNIRDVLLERRGVWITPDISVRADVRDVSEAQRRFRAIVSAATDRRMYDNAFDTEGQAGEFLHRMGLEFRVKRVGHIGRLWIMVPQPGFTAGRPPAI